MSHKEHNLHQAAHMFAAELTEGKLSRREFF